MQGGKNRSLIVLFETIARIPTVEEETRDRALWFLGKLRGSPWAMIFDDMFGRR